MCLGVPGRIVEVDGMVALVDFWGVRREIRLDIVDEPVAPGDLVLNHVGFAIRRIPEHEVAETLELYETLLQAAEADMMAEDVRGEIQAGATPAGEIEAGATPADEIEAGAAPSRAEGSGGTS